MNRQIATITAAVIVAATGIGIGVAVASGGSSKPATVAFAAPVDTTVVVTTTIPTTTTSAAEPSSTLAPETSTAAAVVSTTAPKTVQQPTASTPTNPPATLAPTTLPTAPPPTTGPTTTVYCQAEGFSVGASGPVLDVFLTAAVGGMLTVTRLIEDGVPQPVGETATVMSNGSQARIPLPVPVVNGLSITADLVDGNGVLHPACLNAG